MDIFDGLSDWLRDEEPEINSDTCPQCNGEGCILEVGELGLDDEPEYVNRVDCPYCEGTGCI